MFQLGFKPVMRELCLPPKTVKIGLNGVIEEPKPNKETPKFTPEKTQDTNLWSFIWLAISFGAISLLTPCVFPMIRLRFRIFLKHSHGDHKKSIKLAFVYSVGIIATFTLLGMVFNARFLRSFGNQSFAANPFVNIAIMAIFSSFV